MSNFTFTIEAPELALAISNLAAAMRGPKFISPAPINPTQMTAPTSSTYDAQITAPTFNTYTTPPMPPPMQAATRVIPPPPAPPVVPVAAAPTYTIDQIMIAGAALVDAGNGKALTGLLNAFGAQSVLELKQEQYGVFATELRKMGAQI